MIRDPDLFPPRDPSRKEEPVSWSVFPFTVIFVAGFWFAIWLADQALTLAQWTMFQKVGGFQLYELALLGLLLLIAGILYFHFREVRRSARVAWGQLLIGLSGGLYAFANSTSAEARLLSFLVALVPIADALKLLNKLRQDAKERDDD